MSGSTSCVFFVSILMVICGLTKAQTPPLQPVPGASPCVKFDFDRPSSQFGPLFIVKSYNTVTNPPPYRPNYHNFLTNKSPGYSLAQVTTAFTLNQTSTIETLIYFQPFDGAYFDLAVRDVKTNNVTTILHITTFTSWQIFVKHIEKVIPDGRVNKFIYFNNSFVQQNRFF